MIHQVILRNLIGSITCNQLIWSFENIELDKSIDLKLNDQNSMSNTLYKSNRSKSLEYIFMDNVISREFTRRLKELLLRDINVEFDGGINNKCTPIFKYNNNGVIEPHRDVDKTKPDFHYPNLIAVCLLSQPGVDFEGGEFYINAKATVSADGKKVTDDYPEDRYYPDLNKGDVFIFDNTKFVHGVETTLVNRHQKGRFTASLRTH